jgi:hypothetical protein
MGLFDFFKKKTPKPVEVVEDITPKLPLSFYGRWARLKDPQLDCLPDYFYVDGVYIKIAQKPFPYVNVKDRAQYSDCIGFTSDTEDCKKKEFYHSSDGEVWVHKLLEEYELVHDVRLSKKLECLVRNIATRKKKKQEKERLEKQRFKDSIDKAAFSEKCDD